MLCATHRQSPSHCPSWRLEACRWPLSPGGPAIVRGEFKVLGRSHPWSWPSSGSVERRTSRALPLGTKSGAGLRPTPCARSSARGRRKRAEPALPPPPCGADIDAISTKAIRWVLKHHGHTNKETRVRVKRLGDVVVCC